MIHHFGKLSAVFLFLLLVLFTAAASAQEENRLQIAAVDIAEFPVVHIVLVTADSRSAPADLANLTISENGIPVTDFTLENIPTGIDATFVIDANTGFEEIDDDSGLSRREKILQSIERFTAQYMNEDGLDRVTIIVPSDDVQGGQILVQNESDPQKVVAAFAAYDPVRLGPTPLNAMLNLALEQSQQAGDGTRYQAVLLFSDARRLNEQLSYPLLVALANDAHIPVYGAILGQEADELELDNMARLTETTNAFHVHMPQAEATDPIYQIWQQQGNPIRLSYQSRQRQSGRNQITINLGTILANAEFNVSLFPPEVQLALPDMEIERVGTAVDTPLAALQPQVQPLTVSISWPDNLPRKLIEVIILANNQPQRIADDLLDTAGNRLEIPWDISSLDAGPVELVVQVLDELGYQGQSTPQTVTIAVERPLPATAAPTRQVAETPTDQEFDRGSRVQNFLIIVGLLLLLFGGLTWFWRRRNRKDKAAIAGKGGSLTGTLGLDEDEITVTGVLESISPGLEQRFTLEGFNVTIGSDEESANIVLKDASIGRLHARIRRQEDSFWLFDEGSAAGVTLNYERVGLAPRELHDGDIVQFGNLGFRFSLESGL